MHCFILYTVELERWTLNAGTHWQNWQNISGSFIPLTFCQWGESKPNYILSVGPTYILSVGSYGIDHRYYNYPLTFCKWYHWRFVSVKPLLPSRIAPPHTTHFIYIYIAFIHVVMNSWTEIIDPTNSSEDLSEGTHNRSNRIECGNKQRKEDRSDHSTVQYTTSGTYPSSVVQPSITHMRRYEVLCDWMHCWWDVKSVYCSLPAFVPSFLPSFSQWITFELNLTLNWYFHWIWFDLIRSDSLPFAPLHFSSLLQLTFQSNQRCSDSINRVGHHQITSADHRWYQHQPYPTQLD